MTFKEQALQALYKIQDQVKGAHASTVGDCIRAVKRILDRNNTFACSGRNCPMKLADQIGGKITKCAAHNCEYRKLPMTRADQFRNKSDEELVELAVTQIGCGSSFIPCGTVCDGKCEVYDTEKCRAKIRAWLQEEVSP